MRLETQTDIPPLPRQEELQEIDCGVESLNHLLHETEDEKKADPSVCDENER